MEGRHVHPSTLVPCGVGTVPSVQPSTTTSYGCEEVHRFSSDACRFTTTCSTSSTPLCRATRTWDAEIRLGCWASFQNPDVCDFRYESDERLGARCTSRPASWSTGTDARQPDRITWEFVSCSGARSTRLAVERDVVRTDPLGNPVDPRHPWNRPRCPVRRPAFREKLTWVMSPSLVRRPQRTVSSRSTRRRALARSLVTALTGTVNLGGYVQATGTSVRIRFEDHQSRRDEFEWRIPRWSNTIEAIAPAPTFRPTHGGRTLLPREGYGGGPPGRLTTWAPVHGSGRGPRPAVSTRRARLLSHHVVIRGGKIRELQSLSSDAVEREPSDSFGFGPLRGRGLNTPIFGGERTRLVQGHRLMRRCALRSLPAVRRAHAYGGRQGESRLRNSPCSGTDRLGGNEKPP